MRSSCKKFLRFLLPTFPIFIGALVLVGWSLHIDSLRQDIISSVAMSPATAIGFILLGSETLRLYTGNNIPLANRGGLMAILVVIIATAMKLSDLVLGTSFGIDQLLFSAQLDNELTHPNRMAPNTSISLFLLGWSILTLRSSSRAAIPIAQALTMIPLLLTLLAIVGYIYGTERFYGIGSYIPMAFNTAMAFLFLCLAILFTHPHQGFMCFFTGGGVAGRIAGILLPATIVVPFMVGWITLSALNAKLYDPALDHALSVVVNIALFFALSYFSIRTLFYAELDRKKAEAELRENEAIFSAIFNQSSSGIELIDPGTLRFVEANPAACRMLGYTHEEMLGLRLTDTQANLNETALVDVVQKVDVTGGMTMENRHRCKSGNILEVEIYARILDLPSKRLLVGIWHDITERKEAERRMGYLANHDRLTELPNRELFYDRLSQAISQARRKSVSLAVFFLDLDGFKSINDNYGHDAGDAVLKTVAKRLQECIRDMDTVARLGGDEFAIILNEMGHPEDSSNVAEKVIQTLLVPMEIQGNINCSIGVSIGIAIYPQNGSEIDRLMNAADTAMYESKSHGKNRYTFCKEQANRQDLAEPWISLDSTHLVGIREVDQQHAKIVAMLNKLNTSIKDAEQTESNSLLLDEIIAFTKFHFDVEGCLMDQYEYPDSFDHKQAHQSLLNEVTYLKKKYLEGGESVVLQTLKDWLLLHVANYDKQLAIFLIDHGVE